MLVALVAVTAAHLGVQLTVTLVVYPTLLNLPVDAFVPAHRRHTGVVTPLVVVLYVVLLGTCGAALLHPNPWVVTAVAASVGVVSLTATLAAALLAART